MGPGTTGSVRKAPTAVVKRDGARVAFDRSKIDTAIARAAAASGEFRAREAVRFHQRLSLDYCFIEPAGVGLGKSDLMVKRYAHFASERLRAAANRLLLGSCVVCKIEPDNRRVFIDGCIQTALESHPTSRVA
jgi:hypothetical protein